LSSLQGLVTAVSSELYESNTLYYLTFPCNVISYSIKARDYSVTYCNQIFGLEFFLGIYHLLIISFPTPAFRKLEHDPRPLARKPLCFICKGEAIPLQAWTGPEGSRRLRFPDFETTGT